LEDRPTVKPYRPAMIGTEIRKARLQAGLTQEQLAFGASVSRNYVSLLELDQKSPTLKILFRVCKVLKVKPSKLVAKVE